MTRALRLGAAVVMLALSACAVGPDYHAPTTTEAQRGPFVSMTPAATAPDPAAATWWRLYDDHALDGLIEKALTTNTDLRAAAANLAASQALLSQARAGLFPTTGVTAGPNYGNTAKQTIVPAFWYWQAGFNAAYQADLFGRVRRTIEAAKADAEALAAQVDAVRVTVAAQTAGAYADACAYAQQAAVARAALDQAQQTYDILLRQRAAGAVSDLEVAQQGTILEQARAAVPTLEAQRRAALYALALLTGDPPSKIPQEAAACTSPPHVRQALPVGDGAALLARRPDVREAERRLAAATARIGVATADFYPTISLAGAVNTAATSVGALGSPGTVAFNVGPVATWTFPNMLVARAEVRGANAQTIAALANFDGAILAALKDTETALATYAAALDAHAAIARAQDHAAEAYRLAGARYRAGAISFVDLLIAQAASIAADRALAVSDQQIATDQIAVFQALGGGWEDAPRIATK